MAGDFRTERAGKILDALVAVYGVRPWNWHTRQPPFHVLVGTILSQRTRDEKTDLAAQAVLERFPDPASLAAAPLETVEALVRPANFYRTKARRLREAAAILCRRHGGRVPESLEELTALPGVGRKTANCVLVYGFGKAALPVDVHVHRIANRLGLVRTRTPEETERELWEIVPDRHRLLVNELLVKHGQTLCGPRNPRCGECPVNALCSAGSGGLKDEDGVQEARRGRNGRDSL